jgi:hypothetical protein
MLMMSEKGEQWETGGALAWWVNVYSGDMVTFETVITGFYIRANTRDAAYDNLISMAHAILAAELQPWERVGDLGLEDEHPF